MLELALSNTSGSKMCARMRFPSRRTRLVINPGSSEAEHIMPRIKWSSITDVVLSTSSISTLRIMESCTEVAET